MIISIFFDFAEVVGMGIQLSDGRGIFRIDRGSFRSN